MDECPHWAQQTSTSDAANAAGQGDRGKLLSFDVILHGSLSPSPWKASAHPWEVNERAGEGNSLAVQWLGLRALTARGPGSIPGWGTTIPQATRCGKKINK